MDKILSMRRAEKDALSALKEIVDDVADVSTSRRYFKEGVSAQTVITAGCEDVLRYATSALQFLSAAQLVCRSASERWTFHDAPDVQRALLQYACDSKAISEVPVFAQKEAWQLQFGRYNREVAPRPTPYQHKSCGINTVLISEYIAEVQDKREAFDLACYCGSAMRQYGLSE